MTFEESLNLANNSPIRLVNGQFGLVIRWSEPNEIGVQVPGEDNIRWLKVDTIFDIGGGLLIEAQKGDYLEYFP